MIRVEPKVWLIAETHLNRDTVGDWLSNVGVSDPENVIGRMSGSSDAEMLVELCGRRCYKSFEPNLNPNVQRIRTDSEEYHENILKSRHGSVLEHANFTFAFEFVSRVFTHELVRHRSGCAYSQESMRYVRITDIGFWLPPEIDASPEARRIFEDTVQTLERKQRDLLLLFEQIFHSDNFAAKKKLQSAFRRIAPDGLATGIVATFNARALRHIAELRTHESAEYEIRLAIGKAFKLAADRHPYLFQDFTVEPNVDGLEKFSPEFSKV